MGGWVGGWVVLRSQAAPCHADTVDSDVTLLQLHREQQGRSDMSSRALRAVRRRASRVGAVLPRRVFALGGPLGGGGAGVLRLGDVAKRVVGLPGALRRHVRVLPLLSTLALVLALGSAVVQGIVSGGGAGDVVAGILGRVVGGGGG